MHKKSDYSYIVHILWHKCPWPVETETVLEQNAAFSTYLCWIFPFTQKTKICLFNTLLTANRLQKTLLLLAFVSMIMPPAAMTRHTNDQRINGMNLKWRLTSPLTGSTQSSSQTPLKVKVVFRKLEVVQNLHACQCKQWVKMPKQTWSYVCLGF